MGTGLSTFTKEKFVVIAEDVDISSATEHTAQKIPMMLGSNTSQVGAARPIVGTMGIGFLSKK
jgi:ribosomal protein L7Ae-like RNA K-turn-binding protein